MAELNKLLAFMSSWDRQATLDRYEAMFDEGGDPEAVMEKLGSPTRVAVELAKDYISSPSPGEAVDRDEPEIEVISLEQLLAEEDAGVSPEAEPLSEAEGAPGPDESKPPEPDESKPPEPLRWAPPAPEKTGGGAAPVLYWVLAVVIGLPVTLALFCIGLPFPVAGVVIIARTIRTVPTLFGSFNLLSDALLVAGAGLVRLAAGLLLIWFGIWLSLTLCRLWIFRLILPLGRRIQNGKGARDT